MIYINYDGQESPMLHTKFRKNRPAGSGEEDFWRVFTIYGHGGHLGHVTWTIYINFRSPFPRRLHIKFGFDWSSGFRGEDLWKWWTDGRTDDGRTDDDGRRLDGYTISSPCEPNGSGELKTRKEFAKPGCPGKFWPTCVSFCSVFFTLASQ